MNRNAYQSSGNLAGSFSGNVQQGSSLNILAFNELVNLTYNDGYYTGVDLLTSKGLADQYIPAGKNGYVQFKLEDASYLTGQLIGLNTTNRNDVYTYLEYFVNTKTGGTLGSGGKNFTSLDSGVSMVVGMIVRLERIDGIIYAKYSTDNGNSFITYRTFTGYNNLDLYICISTTSTSRLYKPTGMGLLTRDKSIYSDLLPAYQLNMVFDGDSLTYSQYASSAQYYPNMVRTFMLDFTYPITINSFGINGQSTLDMLSNISSKILPLYDNSKYNVIVAWEDINAILNDARTAQQNFDDIENYITQCKTAGFELCVLVTGYYPRKNLDGTYNQAVWTDGSPNRLDKQHDYFAMCKAQPPDNVDLHIDLRECPVIGGLMRGATIDENYWNDSNHLVDPGYDIIAQFINKKIMEKLYSLL